MGKKAAKKRTKKVARKVSKTVRRKLLAPVPVVPEPTVLTSYKGFSPELRCHNAFQFEVGKTYTHEGVVKRCNSGFHSCPFPLDVFSFYPPADDGKLNRFALVEASGQLCREPGDGKIASAQIHIKAELKIPDLVAEAVRIVMAGVKVTKKGHDTRDYSAASNTGDYSAASNTGDYSAASNTGNKSAASNTGDYSAASVSGKHSVAAAFGAESRAKAGQDGAIVCVYREYADGQWVLKHIAAARVGEPANVAGIVGPSPIKPDTWYTLNEHGQFQEVAA